MSTSPRIALVYDHLLTNYGGAEFVLETLFEAFPTLELFTTVYDKKIAIWASRIPVHTSFLQNFLPIVRKREVLDLLTPFAIEQFDFSSFDLVISVTSSAVKGVLTTPKQPHLCYLLTPTRYLYQDTDTLLEQHHLLSLPLLKNITKFIFFYLRWWDQVAIHRPDKIVTISHKVSERVRQFYTINADTVIYPPVPAVTTPKKFPTTFLPKEFFLSISRLMSYKRIDLAIAACLELKQNLVIVGNGREMTKLLKLAGENAVLKTESEHLEEFFLRADAITVEPKIFFVQTANEEEKALLLTFCKAVIQPGIEDFGITALEAASYGKPAIISAKSGVAEILDTNLSIQLNSMEKIELIKAVKNFDKKSFSAKRLKTVSEQHTSSVFKDQFKKFLFAFVKEHSTI